MPKLARVGLVLAAVSILLPVLPHPAAAKKRPPPVVGRWNLNVTGPDGATFPSWLELTFDDQTGKLGGRLCGKTGRTRPLLKAEWKKNEITFIDRQPEGDLRGRADVPRQDPLRHAGWRRQRGGRAVLDLPGRPAAQVPQPGPGALGQAGEPDQQGPAGLAAAQQRPGRLLEGERRGDQQQGALRGHHQRRALPGLQAAPRAQAGARRLAPASTCAAATRCS